MILIHVIVFRLMILDEFSHNLCHREHNKSRGIRLKWEHGGRDISGSVIHLLGLSGMGWVRLSISCIFSHRGQWSRCSFVVWYNGSLDRMHLYA